MVLSKSDRNRTNKELIRYDRKRSRFGDMRHSVRYIVSKRVPTRTTKFRAIGEAVYLFAAGEFNMATVQH